MYHACNSTYTFNAIKHAVKGSITIVSVKHVASAHYAPACAPLWGPQLRGRWTFGGKPRIFEWFSMVLLLQCIVGWSKFKVLHLFIFWCVQCRYMWLLFPCTSFLSRLYDAAHSSGEAKSHIIPPAAVLNGYFPIIPQQLPDVWDNPSSMRAFPRCF